MVEMSECMTKLGKKPSNFVKKTTECQSVNQIVKMTKNVEESGKQYNRNTRMTTITNNSVLLNSNHVAQLVGCWTHHPRVVGLIPGDADCFKWD